MTDVTILLTTCDAYHDALIPFFTLWKRYWPDCPYRFVINTETKNFDCDDFDVVTMCGGKGLSWSKRLKNCLKKIDTEYILLCLEDYFLQGPVDTDIFAAALKTMRENTRAGVIQFAIDIHTKYDDSITVNEFFSPVPKYKADTHNNRIFCVLSLYRTKYLKKLLCFNESPWEFEIFGSIRSQFFREDVYRENESHDRCFYYLIEPKFGYGISRGKWLPNNRGLFEKHDISVDYSKLGTLDGDDYKAFTDMYYGKRIKQPKEHHTLKQKLLMPFVDPKQFISIVRNVINKKKTDLKMKIKLKIPFLP